MSVDHGRGTQTHTATDHDSSDGQPCGESGTSEAQIPGVDLATPGNGGAEPWRETIDVVATRNVGDFDVATATFALVRQEYQR